MKITLHKDGGSKLLLHISTELPVDVLTSVLVFNIILKTSDQSSYKLLK